MAAHLSRPMDHLLCLENLNLAQVTVQSAGRPNPDAVIRVLCKHELHYLPRAIYETAAANSANPCQPIIKPHMRETLGLWMCQVCVFRELDVFPTAIYIIDRFFSQYTLTCEDQIQLAGAASLHLASKLRETTPMSTEDVLYYTDDSYTPANMQDMELIILAALNFDLVSVTPGHYLDAFINRLDVPVPFQDRIKADSLRRINLALIGTELLTTKPSAIAASCLTASLTSASLSVDGTLLENLCHDIGCDQSKLVSGMNTSINAWTRHYSAVYEVTPENGDERSDEEEDSDNDDLDAFDSDIDMDEGLVVDCGRDRRECPQSSLHEYLMDSDSGIQEDFLSSQSSSGSTPPRRRVSVFDDSDNASCAE